jgi:hypothetical protein
LAESEGEEEDGVLRKSDEYEVLLELTVFGLIGGWIVAKGIEPMEGSFIETEGGETAKEGHVGDV